MESLKRSDRDLSNQISIKTPLTGATTRRRNQSQDRVNQHIGIHKQAAFTSGNHGVVGEAGPGGVTFSEISSSKSLAKGLRLNPRHVPTDVPVDLSDYLQDTSVWEAMEIRFLDKGKCTVLRPNLSSLVSSADVSETTNSTLKSADHASVVYPGAHLLDSPLPIRRQKVCVEKVHVKNLLNTKREKCGNLSSSRLSEYMPLNADVAKEMFEDVEANIRNAKSSSSDLTDSESFESALASNNDCVEANRKGMKRDSQETKAEQEYRKDVTQTDVDRLHRIPSNVNNTEKRNVDIELSNDHSRMLSHAHSPSIVNQSQKSKSNEPVSNQGNSYDRYSCNEDNFKHDRSVMHSNPPTTLRQKMSKMNVSGFSNADTNGEPSGVSVGNHSNQMHWSKVTNPLMSNGESCSEIVYNKTGPSDAHGVSWRRFTGSDKESEAFLSNVSTEAWIKHCTRCGAKENDTADTSKSRRGTTKRTKCDDTFRSEDLDTTETCDQLTLSSTFKSKAGTYGEAPSYDSTNERTSIEATTLKPQDKAVQSDSIIVAKSSVSTFSPLSGAEIAKYKEIALEILMKRKKNQGNSTDTKSGCDSSVTSIQRKKRVHSLTGKKNAKSEKTKPKASVAKTAVKPVNSRSSSTGRLPPPETVNDRSIFWASQRIRNQIEKHKERIAQKSKKKKHDPNEMKMSPAEKKVGTKVGGNPINTEEAEPRTVREKKTLQKNAPSETSFTVSSAHVDTKNLGKKKSESPLSEKKILVKEKSFMALKMVPTAETPTTKCDRPLTNVESHEIKYAFADQSEGGRSISHTTDERFLIPGTKTLVGETQTESSLANTRGEYKSVATGPVASDLMYLDVLDFKDDMLSQPRELPLQALNSTQTETACKLHKTCGSSGIQVQPNSLSQVPQSPANERPRHSSQQIRYLELLQNILKSPTSQTTQALGMFLHKPKALAEAERDLDITVDQIINSYQEIFNDFKGAVPNRSYSRDSLNQRFPSQKGFGYVNSVYENDLSPTPHPTCSSLSCHSKRLITNRDNTSIGKHCDSTKINSNNPTETNVNMKVASCDSVHYKCRFRKDSLQNSRVPMQESNSCKTTPAKKVYNARLSSSAFFESEKMNTAPCSQRQQRGCSYTLSSCSSKHKQVESGNCNTFGYKKSQSSTLMLGKNTNLNTPTSDKPIAVSSQHSSRGDLLEKYLLDVLQKNQSSPRQLATKSKTRCVQLPSKTGSRSSLVSKKGNVDSCPRYQRDVAKSTHEKENNQLELLLHSFQQNVLSCEPETLDMQQTRPAITIIAPQACLNISSTPVPDIQSMSSNDCDRPCLQKKTFTDSHLQQNAEARRNLDNITQQRSASGSVMVTKTRRIRPLPVGVKRDNKPKDMLNKSPSKIDEKGQLQNQVKISNSLTIPRRKQAGTVDAVMSATSQNKGAYGKQAPPQCLFSVFRPPPVNQMTSRHEIVPAPSTQSADPKLETPKTTQKRINLRKSSSVDSAFTKWNRNSLALPIQENREDLLKSESRSLVGSVSSEIRTVEDVLSVKSIQSGATDVNNKSNVVRTSKMGISQNKFFPIGQVRKQTFQRNEVAEKLGSIQSRSQRTVANAAARPSKASSLTQSATMKSISASSVNSEKALQSPRRASKNQTLGTRRKLSRDPNPLRSSSNSAGKVRHPPNVIHNKNVIGSNHKETSNVTLYTSQKSNSLLETTNSKRNEDIQPSLNSFGKLQQADFLNESSFVSLPLENKLSLLENIEISQECLKAESAKCNSTLSTQNNMASKTLNEALENAEKMQISLEMAERSLRLLEPPISSAQGTTKNSVLPISSMTNKQKPLEPLIPNTRLAETLRKDHRRNVYPLGTSLDGMNAINVTERLNNRLIMSWKPSNSEEDSESEGLSLQAMRRHAVASTCERIIREAKTSDKLNTDITNEALVNCKLSAHQKPLENCFSTKVANKIWPSEILNRPNWLVSSLRTDIEHKAGTKSTMSQDTLNSLAPINAETGEEHEEFLKSVSSFKVFGKTHIFKDSLTKSLNKHNESEGAVELGISGLKSIPSEDINKLNEATSVHDPFLQSENKTFNSPEENIGIQEIKEPEKLETQRVQSDGVGEKCGENPVLPSLEDNVLRASGIMAGAEVLESLEVKSEKVAPRGYSEITNLNIEAVWDTSISNLNEQSMSEKICKDIKPKELKSDDTFMCISAQLRSSDIGSDDPIIQKTTCSLIVENTHEKQSSSSVVVTGAEAQKEEREMLPRITEVLSSNENPLPSYREDVAHDQKAIKNDAAESLTKACQCPPSPTPEQTTGDHSCGVVLKPLESLEQKLEKTVKEAMSSCEQQLEAGLRFSATVDTVLLEGRSSSENVSISMRGYSHTDICKYSQGMSRGLCSEENDLRFCDISPEALQALTAITTPTVTLPSDTAHVVLRSVSEDPLNDVLSNSNVETLTTMNIDLKLAHHSADARDEAIQVINENLGRSADVTNTKCTSKVTKPEDEQICQQREVLTVTTSTVEKHGSSASSAVVDKEIKGKLSSDQDLSDLNVIGGNAPASRSISESRDGCNDSEAMTRSVPTKSVHDSQPFVCRHCLQCTDRPPEGTRLPSQEVKMKIRIEFCEDDTSTRAAKHDQPFRHCLCFPVLSSPEKKSVKELTFHLGTNSRHLVRKPSSHTTFDQYSAGMPRTDCYQWAKKGSESNIFSLPEFSPSTMKSKESYESHECRWEKRDRRVSTPYSLSCDRLANDETHDLDTIGYDRDSPSFKVDSFRGSITSLERWDRLNVFQASESTDTYPSTSRSTADVHSFHLRNEPTATNISLRTCKTRKTVKKRKYCNAQTQVLCSEMKHSGKLKTNGDNTEQRSAEEEAISSRSILGTPALANITGAAGYNDLTSVRSGTKSVSKLACLPRHAIEQLTTLDTVDISSLKETCIASKDIDIPKALAEHSAAKYTGTEQNKVNESSTTVRILSRKKKINENLIQQKAAENLEMFINSVKELKKCEKHSSPPFKPNSGLLTSRQTCIHTSAPENLEKFSRVSISGKFQDNSSSSMMDKFYSTCQFRSVPWLPCDQLEPNVMEELSLSFSEKMFNAKKIHSPLCDTIGHKVIYRPSSTLQKGAAISASPTRLNYLKRLQGTSKKESEFVKSLVFQSSARAHSDASVNTVLSINPVRPFEMETTSDSENTETVLSYLYSTSPRQQAMVNRYGLPENKDFYTQVHSASSGLNDWRKTEVPAHSRRLINQSRAQRDVFIDSLNVIHRINAGYCDTESEIRKQRTFTQRNPFVCTNPFYSNSFESTLAERIDEYISMYSTPRETRLHSSGVDDHACFRSLEDRALVGLREDYLQTIKNEFDPLKETRQCAFTAEELVAFFGLEDENKVESLSHSQPKEKRCCSAQNQNGGSSKKSRDSYEINEFRRKDLSPGANKKKEQVSWDQFQSAPHESSDTLLLDLTCCEVSCMSKRQKGCREFEERHCNGAKFDSVYSDTNDQYLTVPSDQTACNAADREEPNYNKATAIDLKNKVETRSHDFGSTLGKSVSSPKLIRSPSEMSLEASRLSPCLEEYYSYSPFLCACSETPLLHSGTETYDIRKHWASTSVNSSITDTSGSPSVCSDDITSGSAGVTSKSAIKMDIMDSIGILTSHLMTTYIMVKDKMKRRQLKNSKTKLKRLDHQGRNFVNPYNNISSGKENRSKKFVFKKRHQANTTKKHFSTKRARFSSRVYKQLLKQTRSSSDTSSKESVDYTSSNNSEKTCDYLPTGELVSMLTVNYQEPPSNLEVTESKAYHLGSTINNHTLISPELSNETLSRMEKDIGDKETTGMFSLGQCLSQDDNKNSKVVCLIHEHRFSNEPNNYSEAILTEDGGIHVVIDSTEDGGIHVVIDSTEEAHADLKNEFESTESINNGTESHLERQPSFVCSGYPADKCFNQEITRFKGVEFPEDAEASKFIKLKLSEDVEANTVRDLKLSDDIEANQFKDLKLSDDVEANQFKDLKLSDDIEANQFKDLKLSDDIEANQFKDLKLSDDIEANTFIELKLSEVAEANKFKDLKSLEDVETNKCIDLKLCEDEVPASEGEDLYDKPITELQSKSKELIEKNDSLSQYKLRSSPELIRNSVESSNLEATNNFEVKLLGEATTVVDNVEEFQSEPTDDFEFAEFIDTNAESPFEKQQSYVFCGNPYNQSVRSMPCLQTFLVLLGGTDVFSFSQQPDFSDVKDTGCDTHDFATADYDASLVEERDSTEDIPEIQTKGYRALLLENMCEKLLLESASENDSQEEFVEPVSECDFPDQTQDIVYQTKMFEQDYDGGIHEVVFLTKDVAGESADPDFQSPNVWCKDSGWSLEGRDNPEKMNSTETNELFGRHNLLQEDDKDLSWSHSTRRLRKLLKRERRSFSCSKRRCDSRCWSKQGFSETGRQYFKCLQENRCSSRRSFKPFISRRICLNRILGTDNRDVQCSPQLRYDSPEIVTTDWKDKPQASLDEKIESIKTPQAETARNLFNRTYSCRGHEEWLHFRNAPLDSTPLSDILTEFDEKCASPDYLERKTEAKTESPYIFDDYELDTYEELRSLFTELHGSSSSSSLMLEADDTQDSSLYHCGQTLSISSTTLEERESRLGSSHSEKERENCNTWCATQTLLTVHQYISDLTSTSSIFIDPELINPIVSDECVNEEAASIKEHKYNNTKAVQVSLASERKHGKDVVHNAPELTSCFTQTECSEAESVDKVSVTKSDYSSYTHFRTILHKCLQSNSFLSYLSQVVDEKLAQKLTEARTQGTPNENISPKLPKPMPRTALSLQGFKWHTPQLSNNEKADQDKKERNSIDETKSETKLSVDKLKFTNSYDVSPTSETRQTSVVDADKISHADELADLSDVCKIAASKLVTENKISLRRLYRGRETFVTKKVLSESEGHPISSSSLLIMWSDSSEQPTIEDEHLGTEEMTPTSISCLRSGRRLFCSPGSPPLQSTKNHVTAKEAILCDKACSAVNITDFSSTSHKRAVHLSPPTTRVKNMQNDPLRHYSSDPVLKVFSQRESSAKSNASSTNIVKNSDSTGTVTSADYGRLKNILSAETKMLWKSLTRLEKNSEKCQVCRLQYNMMLSNSSDRMDFLKLDDDEMDHVYHYHDFVSQENAKPDDTNPTPETLFETQEVNPISQTAQSNAMHEQKFESQRRTPEYDVAKSKNNNEIVLNDTCQNLFQKKMNHESHVSKLSRLFDRIDENGHNVSDKLCPCNAKTTSLVAKDNKELKVDSFNNANTTHELKKQSTRVREDKDPSLTLNHTVKHVFQLSSELDYSSKCHESADFEQKPSKVCLSRSEMSHNQHESSQPQERRATSDFQRVPHTQVKDKTDERNLRKDEVLSDDIQSNSLSDRDGANPVKFRVSDHSDSTLSKQLLDSIIDAHDNVPDSAEPETINTKPKSSKILDANVNDLKLSSHIAAPKLAECTSCDAATSTTSRHNNCPPIDSSKAPQSLKKQRQHYTKHTSSDTADYWIERLMNILHEMHETFPNTGTTSSLPANFRRSSPQTPYTKTLSTDQGTFPSSERVLPAKNDEKMDNLSDETSTHSNLKMKHVSAVGETKELIAPLCKDDTTLLGKSSLELNTSLLEATLSNGHTHEIQSSSADNAPCFLDGAQSSSSHNLAREQTGETSNCLLPNHKCAHEDTSDVEHRSSCTKLDLSIKVDESVQKRNKLKKRVESTVYQCTTKSAERWDSSPKLFEANTAQQECFSLTESCSFKKTSAPDSGSRVNESLWALSEPLDMHHLKSVATVTSDCPVWDQIRFSVSREQQKPLSSKENTFSKSPFKLSGNPVKVIFASPSVLYKKYMLRKSKSLIELGHISYLNKSFNAPQCIATDARKPENTSSVQAFGCKQSFQSFMPRKSESEINHYRLTSDLSSTETVNTSMKSLKHEDKILTTLVQQDHNEKYVAIKLDNNLPLQSKTVSKTTFSNVPSPQDYTPVIKSESYITNAISRTRASPKYSKSLDPVVKCSGLSRETPKRYCDSQEVLAYVRARAKQVEEFNEQEHKATSGSEISRDYLKHIGMNQSETVAICLNPVKDVSSSVEKPSQNCQIKETNNDSLGTEGRYYDSTGFKGERKNNDSPVTEGKNNDSPVTEGKNNDSPVTEGENNDSPGNEGENNDLPGTEGKSYDSPETEWKSYDSPSTEVKRDDGSFREKNCNQKRNSNFEIDTTLSNKDRDEGPAKPLKEAEAVVGPCPTLGVTVNKERDKCIVSVDCSSRLNFAELNETDIKTGAQPDSSTTEPGLDHNPEDLEILERDCCTLNCGTSVNDFEHYTKSLNQRVSKMTADRKVNALSSDVAEDISQRFSDICLRINTSKVVLDTVDQHLPNNISEDNANQGILCDNVIPKISDNFMEDKMSQVFSDSVLGVDNSKAVVDTVDQYISNDISGDNGNQGIPCDNIAPNISDSLNGETISQVFSDGILGVDTSKVVFGMVNQRLSNNISGENANQGIPCDSLGPNSSGNVNGDKMGQNFSDSILGLETSKIGFDTVSELITDQTISNNVSVFDANQGIPDDNIVLKDPDNVNGDTINKDFSDHVHAVDAHRDIFCINEMATSNIFSKTAQNVIDKYPIASSKSDGSKNIAEETQQVCCEYNPTAKVLNYRKEKCPWKVLTCEDSETDTNPVAIGSKRVSDDSCPLKSHQIKSQLNSPIEVEQLNAADDLSSKIKLDTHFKMYQIKSPVNSSPMEVGGQINEAEEISFKNKPDLDLGIRFKSYQLKSQLNSLPMEVGRQLNAADEISCKNKLDIRLCRQEESNDRNEKSVAEIDNGPSLNKFNQIETKNYRVHIDSSRAKSGEEDNLVNKCTISSCDEGIGNNFFIRNDKNVKLNSLRKKSDTFSNDRYSEDTEKTPTNSQLKQSDVSLKTSVNTELNMMTSSNFTSKPAAGARSPDFKMTCSSGVPAKSAQLFQKLLISPTTPVPDLNVIKSQLKPVSALKGSHAISGSCTGAHDENGTTGKRNSPVYSSDVKTETTSLKTDESTITNNNHAIGRYMNCEIREVLSDACSLHNKPDRCELTSPPIKSSLEGYNSHNLDVSSPSDKSDQSSAKYDQSSCKSDQSALNEDYGNSVEALEGYFPEDLYPNSERSGQASSEIPNENICSFMQETSVKSDNYEMEDDRDIIIKDEEIPGTHSLEIPVDIYTLPLRPSHKESSFHKKKKKRKEPSATRTVVISGPLSNCSIPVIRHTSQNERSEFEEGDSSSQKLTGALSSNGTQRAESCRKKSSHKESPPGWMSSLRNILPFRKKASEKHKEMSHK